MKKNIAPSGSSFFMIFGLSPAGSAGVAAASCIFGGAHRVEGAKFDGAHPSGAGAACANRNCGRVLSATRGVSAMPPAVARRPTASRRCIIKRGGTRTEVR